MRRAFATGFWICAASVASAQTDHVIVIGIDGLGAQAILENPTPNIHRLMSSGAWSLKSRGVMPTVSSPNWASMIMGAGPEQHGVISNEWKPDRFEFSPVCRGLAPTFPTILGVLREQRRSDRITILHDWDDFARLVEPGVATLIKHTPGSPATVTAAIQEWREHSPNLLFLHLDDVDHAGHDHGWETQAYREAVAAIDGLVGKLVEAVMATPAGARTAFLLSADHGGVGKKHGGNTMAELEIPWVASGAGIVRNREIREPVNTYDTAATIAELLKLKTPACWLGRPVREALASFGTWAGLQTVPAGDELEIHSRKGEITRAPLIGVSETQLTVAERKGTINLSRQEVARVYRRVPKSAKRATLIGLGLGAAGFLLGAAGSAARDGGESGEHWLGAVIGAAIGTSGGALTGYIIGGRANKVLIYTAP